MRLGGRAKLLAVEIDLAEPDAGERTPVGEVLEPRQRRLAHQVGVILGRPADGDLQGRIALESIDIIAILIASRDHEHRAAHHLGIAVSHAGRIARVAKRPGDGLGQPKRVAISRNTITPPSEDRRPASKVAVSGLPATGDRLGKIGVAHGDGRCRGGCKFVAVWLCPQLIVEVGGDKSRVMLKANARCLTGVNQRATKKGLARRPRNRRSSLIMTGWLVL